MKRVGANIVIWGNYLVPVHKWLFCPNSLLLSKFYPRNIAYMPVVKFIERLDLNQNISFMDRHYLARSKQSAKDGGELMKILLR